MKTTSLILFLGSMVIGLSGCQTESSLANRLTRVENARAHIEASTKAVYPARPRDLNLFDTYKSNDDCLRSRYWTKRINLTGVAMDRVQTCTLISPIHVLMAQHYQRKEGDTVVFHDKGGRKIVRIIEAKGALPGGLMPDIAVARLERPVPLPFFKVLPPRSDYHRWLAGSLAVVTDKDRNLLVRRILTIGNRHVRFQKATEFAPKCADPLITGDSGNPSFVMINGEPILIETHTYGGMGQGPFVSDPQNYEGINGLMDTLGGGHQLTTIALKGPPEPEPQKKEPSHPE